MADGSFFIDIVVPPEYFAHLDVNGRRLDLEQRPELLRGTVDMIVPKDYWVQDPPESSSSSTATTPRPPQPLHYIFAIDVSCDISRRRGPPNEPQEPHAHPMLREVTRSLKELIYGTESDENAEATEGETEPTRKGSLPPGAKIAIVTFDKVVHFYNLKAGLDKAQMLVVGDIDDMFVPLSEGFLVDAWESR
jgi:protein transport protein SEC24